jgi:hypothetical protein
MARHLDGQGWFVAASGQQKRQRRSAQDLPRSSRPAWIFV